MPPAPEGSRKGCRRCHIRRIACDQTEPACKKCLKKGFECPGYGRDFRWTNAVAVRGYLRGRNVPVRPGDRPGSDVTAVAGPSSSSPPLSGPSSSPAFSEPSRSPEFLLEHYISVIAPDCVWIDSDRNEYKKIIPLAQRQPVLMLAIQAASAAHLAENAEISDRLCNEAMTLMASMIKPILHPGANSAMGYDADEERLEALLASMLILSEHSLISAKPSEAQAHRQAARAITNVLSGRETRMYRFLKNQIAEYEIIACTTLDEAADIQTSPDNIFHEYMTLLHGITQLSCERKAGDGIPPPLPSAEGLEQRLDMAMGSTFLAASPLLHGRPESFRRDFVRCVQLYHHAIIIYAFDRLKLREGFAIRDTSRRKIFSILESLEEFTSMSQNIPWPVLIAGTAAHQDERKQKMARDVFRRLSTYTYFAHYLNIISFLDELWKDPLMDWIELAKRYRLNGCPIIAI